MKKWFCLLFIVGIACQSPKTSNPVSSDSTIVVNYDTIPETRKTVKTTAVAEFSERVGGDNLNDWKLGVQVYETKSTFHFLVRVRYKELRVSNSLHIPNFGIQPKIELRRGKEPLSCIIGFLDKKGEFKEYKLVSTKNDHLRISKLASYYVGAYRTKQ
jgi:hypothetical protein